MTYVRTGVDLIDCIFVLPMNNLHESYWSFLINCINCVELVGASGPGSIHTYIHIHIYYRNNYEKLHTVPFYLNLA